MLRRPGRERPKVRVGRLLPVCLSNLSVCPVKDVGPSPVSSASSPVPCIHRASLSRKSPGAPAPPSDPCLLFSSSQSRLRQPPCGPAAPEPAPPAPAPRHCAPQRAPAAGLRPGRAQAEAVTLLAHLPQADTLPEVAARLAGGRAPPRLLGVRCHLGRELLYGCQCRRGGAPVL